jgi:hypothetical protein
LPGIKITVFTNLIHRVIDKINFKEEYLIFLVDIWLLDPDCIYIRGKIVDDHINIEKAITPA